MSAKQFPAPTHERYKLRALELGLFIFQRDLKNIPQRTRLYEHKLRRYNELRKQYNELRDKIL